MNDERKVLVVDARERFVGYVNAAVARRALKEQRARIWRKSPFVIMLPPGVDALPAFKIAERTSMYTPTNTVNAGPMNWFKFFQEERELWVQNISATQLSMQFELGPGLTSGVLVPVGPDPVCITNEVPFESVKKSIDFRKFLNRVPAVMKLLTAEQAMDIYADKARAMHAFIPDPATGRDVPNVAAAIEHAERERRQLTTRPTDEGTIVGPNGQITFAPPKTAQELMNMNMPQHMGVSETAAQAAGLQHLPQGMMQGGGFNPQAAGFAAPFNGGQPQGFSPQAAGFSNIGGAPVMMENVINPRVLNLCQQVSSQLPANMRMPADQFFREIKLLAPSLTLEEWQYIEAHGTYKTVKKFARDMQAKLVAAGQGEGIEDGLDDMT